MPSRLTTLLAATGAHLVGLHPSDSPQRFLAYWLVLLGALLTPLQPFALIGLGSGLLVLQLEPASHQSGPQ